MIETIDWLDWNDVRRDAIRGERVYLGDATCERRLPSVDAAMEIARRLRGIEITIVTPFVSENGLARVEAIVDALRSVVSPLEVVCNDWGVLDLVAGRPRCVPIAGRLLVGQATDPRWAGAMDAAFQRPFERTVRHVDGTEAMLRYAPPPPALVRHLQHCALDAPAAYALLAGYGVRRIEINNVLQGIDLEPPPGWCVSVHVPDVLVSVARDCSALPLPYACRDGCPDDVVLRHASFPVELVQRGNAVYYRNETIPKHFAIDRAIRSAGVRAGRFAGVSPAF